MKLPKIVTIQLDSNRNYLRPTGLKNVLKFDELVKVSPDGKIYSVKHEVVKASPDGNIFYFRCVDDTIQGDWVHYQHEGATKEDRMLMKASFKTNKYGVSVVNFEVRYNGKWECLGVTNDGYLRHGLQGERWSIGGDRGGHSKARCEDFIVSDWELLPKVEPTRHIIPDLELFPKVKPRGEMVDFKKSGGEAFPRVKPRGEDFIKPDWDHPFRGSTLPPGASDGDKNTHTGGGVLIGDKSIDGGIFFESSDINAHLSIGNTTVHVYQMLPTTGLGGDHLLTSH